MNGHIARVASQRARSPRRGFCGRWLDEQPSAGSSAPSLRLLTGTMRTACTLLTGLALLITGNALAYDLSPHLWQNRLLFLVSDSAADPRHAAQREVIDTLRDEVIDRDLVVFELFTASGNVDGLVLGADDVAELRTQLGVAPGDRQMILIGLDGGIKRRGELDTELQAVFGQIDGMPMRRQELRERGRLTE
jgi:hypothetical protein